MGVSQNWGYPLSVLVPLFQEATSKDAWSKASVLSVAAVNCLDAGFWRVQGQGVLSLCLKIKLGSVGLLGRVLVLLKPS